MATMHVSFADKVASALAPEESFGSTSRASVQRDYGGTSDSSSDHRGSSASGSRVKWKNGVNFFGNKRSLTIDFGGFAFSSSQRDIAWYSLYCFIYIALAVVAFSFVFEKWTVIDSIYFAVTTFSTVGFGDKVPSKEAGRIFTTFFALYGIIMLGIFVGIVGYAIGKAQYKEIKKLKAGSRQSVLEGMFPNHVESLSSHRKKSRNTLLKEASISVFADVQQVGTKAFPLLLAVVVLACILGALEDWPISSSLYFCIIASTTTGYGDFVPTTQWTKLYCILFVPFAVAVFANTLGRIAGVYIRRKNRLAERKFMRRSITLCDLRAMDANDDGMVSMEEFLTFMLVALQKVDRELLDELRSLFRALDTNQNGVLEKDDLIAHTMGSRDWELLEQENSAHDEEKGSLVDSSSASLV